VFDHLHIPLPDIAAVTWFFLCWFGYTQAADRLGPRETSLLQAMEVFRHTWMTRMLDRDNRIADTAIVTTLTTSVSFFASTSMVILAGIVTAMGATDQLMQLAEEMPLVIQASALVWHLKLLMLLLIFTYSFFKLTWSLRQWNYVTVMIGAAPPTAAPRPARQRYAEVAGKISTLATKHYNRGIRAYYFGVAALAWFVHPIALMAVSAYVVLVLYRREFRSNVLRLLREAAAVETEIDRA